MWKSRKKRLLEQRKQAATLKQLKDRLRKSEKSVTYYQKKAFTAERRNTVEVELPSVIIEDVITHALSAVIHSLTIAMEEPVYDVRSKIEREIARIEKGMVIRVDDNASVSSRRMNDIGDVQVSFDFPQFRWTQIIDRETIRSIKGEKSGIMYMQDRPLYYTKNAGAYRGDDGSLPSSTIPYKTF